MGSITPNPKKRSYLLPPGCKNLVDVLEGKRRQCLLSAPRVNGKITAPEVRIIGERGKQLGIMSVTEALSLAQSRSLDLVEIAPKAKPPICRIVDYGKFRFLDIGKLRYEQSKQGKKHT